MSVCRSLSTPVPVSVRRKRSKSRSKVAVMHIIYTTRKLKCKRVQHQNGLKNRTGELKNEEEEETEMRRKKKGTETWDSE